MLASLKATICSCGLELLTWQMETQHGEAAKRPWRWPAWNWGCHGCPCVVASLWAWCLKLAPNMTQHRSRKHNRGSRQSHAPPSLHFLRLLLTIDLQPQRLHLALAPYALVLATWLRPSAQNLGILSGALHPLHLAFAEILFSSLPPPFLPKETEDGQFPCSQHSFPLFGQMM